MTLLLRTLTLKSVLGFGYEQIRDQRIGDLIKANYFKTLISAYYGMSMISFTDDVLDILKIEIRIEKPGKVECVNERNALINDCIHRVFQSKSELEQKHYLADIHNSQKTMTITKKITNNFNNSKISLRNKHQKR